MLTIQYLKNNLKYFLLIAVGLISTFGKLVGSEQIQGIGFLTAASPLPLVFSSFRGVEGFALSFRVSYELDGVFHQLEITPEIYQNLDGPYNRRNIYGAAIVGIPMLNRQKEKVLLEKIRRYGFCDGPLAREFGIKGQPNTIELSFLSKTRGDDREWKVVTSCDN